MLRSETDLPPDVMTEIASILAKGYLCYRASLRRAQLAPESVSPSRRPALNVPFGDLAAPACVQTRSREAGQGAERRHVNVHAECRVASTKKKASST